MTIFYIWYKLTLTFQLPWVNMLLRGFLQFFSSHWYIFLYKSEILMNKTSFGRKKIYSSLEPTPENIPIIINKSLLLHNENKAEMLYLIDYFLGKQPVLDREKSVRSDINNPVVINHAWEAVRDITGYFMGSPVQYTLRNTEKQESIKYLNDFMDYENRSAVDKRIEDFSSICGIGYKCTLYDENPINDVPFNLTCLSPLNTFVVYGVSMGNPQILSVNMFSYFDENDNEMIRYVAYTDTHSYELIAPRGASLNVDHYVQAGLPHMLGLNPIVPYENNQWLMGDFETCLSLLDAINTLAANSVDDVEQVVQSILLLFGIPEGQIHDLEELSNGDILAFTGVQGVNQDGKYLVAQLDSAGAATLREYLEESYRVVVGIPDRKTRGGGGGDTGDAVKLRDGWADMELVARSKEMFWREAELKSLKVAFNILHNTNAVTDLSLLDLDIKFSRNKNDNLQSKVQAGSTLYSMKVAKEDVASAMDITTDVTEFVKRWEESEAESREIQQEMFERQSAITNQNNQNDYDDQNDD